MEGHDLTSGLARVRRKVAPHGRAEENWPTAVWHCGTRGTSSGTSLAALCLRAGSELIPVPLTASLPHFECGRTLFQASARHVDPV
jgi:hypothetical protein